MSFKRILLVKPKGRKGLGFSADVIPIGLEYIAASIEKEVDDVRIIDMEFEKRPFQRFLTLFQPDLVGITMSATDHDEGLRLAKIAKDNGITTLLGGYHPTAIPNELLSHPQVDMIVRGEGELTMEELLQKGSPEGVLGISYKKGRKIIHNLDRSLIENLDSLPFPARHLRKHKYRNHLDNDSREIDVISMSRGCRGRCTFCCEPFMNKSRMRFRSPENVMKELLEIVSFHKEKPLGILVTDPHFMGDPERIDRLCNLLHKHKLDIIFSVMTRVDSIARNPKLVKKMCDNGIPNYELGIESPDLKDLNNTKKGITLEMQRKAVKILRDNGANVSGTFVIGLPGQTEEEIKQFPVYAKKIGLMNAAFGIATPFPRTEFYNTLAKKGWILERDWTKYDEMHSIFKLDGISRKRLEELETYCMTRFWTLNTLLDRAKILQKRYSKKMLLKDFLEDITRKIEFGKNAGGDLRKGEFEGHLKVALEAIADAAAEENKRKADICNVVEMSRFLDILGPQTIQCTLRYRELQPISYVMKTTKSSKIYSTALKTIFGKRNDATISIDIDLNGLMNLADDDLSFNPIKTFIFLVRSARNAKGIWNMLKLFTALAVEFGFSYLKR